MLLLLCVCVCGEDDFHRVNQCVVVVTVCVCVRVCVWRR